MAIRTVRLGSSGLVHAPGVFEWAKNGWFHKKDQPRILAILEAWDVKLTREQWDRVLTSKVPSKVDGETVVFEIEEDTVSA